MHLKMCSHKDLHYFSTVYWNSFQVLDLSTSQNSFLGKFLEVYTRNINFFRCPVCRFIDSKWMFKCDRETKSCFWREGRFLFSEKNKKHFNIETNQAIRLSSFASLKTNLPTIWSWGCVRFIAPCMLFILPNSDHLTVSKKIDPDWSRLNWT